MIPELGHFALILAVMLAVMQAGLPLLARGTGREGLQSLVLPTAALQWLCVTIAFAALIVSYIDSDFTVANVVANSHTDKPVFFKIAAAWGNHEGSMLLWVWVLSVYGFFLSLADFGKERELQEWTLAVQGFVAAGFIAFILLTSNPFLRVFPPPTNGEDLNPLLQDIGLTLHPPLLYLGYVGFSIVYAMAVAALLQGRLNREWARLARPWILVTWSFLTLGIGMGGWWAYRELGWGGWWFWDPVENASLLPWLAGTALLHSNLTLEKRGTLAGWVPLLAILTFTLSLIGTFLVRSGIITSVHSFASDPQRGLFILGYLIAVAGAALLLYGMKAEKLKPGSRLSLMSREGSIVINNLLVLTMAATILLATLYPMLLELLADRHVSIGAPYYQRTFFPLLVPVVALAGIAPFLAWKKARLKENLRGLRYPLAAAVTALILTALLAEREKTLAAGGMALAVWLIAASLFALFRHGLSFKKIPPGKLGAAVAHLGVGILLMGIVGSGLWQREAERVISAGDRMKLGSWELHYQGDKQIQGSNYMATRGKLEVLENGQRHAALLPEFRFYPVRQTTTSEASIDWSPWRDLYAVISPSADGKTTQLRFYDTPLISFVWAGFILIAAGGALAALPGRHKKKEA